VADVGALLAGVVGGEHVRTGAEAAEDYRHDEALTATAREPGWVVRPAAAEEVAGVLRIAAEHGVPVTARGSGTGMCGACVPRPDGILVSFERMAAVLEVDPVNQVAVVQPGVTLVELDAAAAAEGLSYPVAPGEQSASLGGTVGTNAGGMRAVRYGVTRQNVLGLEAVLPTGEVIRSGGKIAKVSSGYDLTQLIIGSEGTLALVTEVTVRLVPRPAHRRTVLAPFPDLDGVIDAVPKIIATGLGPSVLEYIDWLTMAAITHTAELSLGIPDALREQAKAYLVVALENANADRLDEDVEALGGIVTEQLGALDAFVLDGPAAAKLIQAREHAFWTAKAAGAHDIVDVVVPRGNMAAYLGKVRELGEASGSGVVGCGHAGDGNVHLAVFQADAAVRHELMRGILAAGIEFGGAISGEHGIGTEKKPYFLALEDPAKLALLRRIKLAFDPRGILNPDVLFDSADDTAGELA
jgi:glycolate oxidase